MKVTTSLLTKYLHSIVRLAETIYGPRMDRYMILPVEFHPKPPQYFFRSETQIQVRIRDYCADDFVRACYQLAHESIHLLSPVVWQEITVLEEGLATSFAHYYIKEYLATEYPSSGECRYDSARATFEQLSAQYPTAIRQLRQHQKVISRINESDLQDVCPQISQSTVNTLTKLFYVNGPT